MFLTGTQLHAARALAGLSRAELASMAGLNVNRLGDWERSSNAAILAKVGNLKRVIGVLEVQRHPLRPDGVFMRRVDPVPTISTVVPSEATA